MITQVTFTPAAGGASFQFMGTGKTVQTWDAKIPPRGTARGRLNGHGRHPRAALFSGLDIQLEGKLFSTTHTALVALRDELLAAMFGDLTAAPFATKLGELKVQKEGWTEAAAGDVVLQDYSMAERYSPGFVVEYMFQFECADPFFVGPSGTVYRL